MHAVFFFKFLIKYTLSLNKNIVDKNVDVES